MSTAKTSMRDFRQALQAGGLTQQQIAETLGVSKQFVSAVITEENWETPNRVARAVMIGLAEKLGMKNVHKSDKLYRYVRLCMRARLNAALLTEPQRMELLRTIKTMRTKDTIIDFDRNVGWGYVPRMPADGDFFVRVPNPSEQEYYLLQIPTIT